MPGISSKSSADGRSQNGASVDLELRSRQEFLSGYDSSFPSGGVFCPTRGKAVKGAPATVTINLGRRQPPLVLAGRVAWRRPGRHLQKIRAGICVEFLPSEKPKIDYLLDLAKAGDTVRSRRRHERLPVDVPVNWHLPGATPARGMLRDIGRGGAFIRSNAPAPSDSEVVLELSPPGAQVAMEFTARVAWTAAQGPEAGFGVEWRARDAGGGKRIRELVRRLTAVAEGLS
ncbi:MAG TPA: PilZ domain-containing protein [Polyangia bacterium]